MPRVLSEQYVVTEEPATKRSTGTGDVQSFRPAKPCVAVWVTVEGVDARMTFGGATPGVGTGPGVVAKAGAMPQIFPLRLSPRSSEPGIKFAANVAGNCDVSVAFCE